MRAPWARRNLFWAPPQGGFVGGHAGPRRRRGGRAPARLGGRAGHAAALPHDLPQHGSAKNAKAIVKKCKKATVETSERNGYYEKYHYATCKSFIFEKRLKLA